MLDELDAVTGQVTEESKLGGRDKTAFQSPVLQEFYDPLAVLEISLLAASGPVVFRIDQQQLEPDSLRAHSTLAPKRYRLLPWRPQSNAPGGSSAAPRFRVTHPFHPLFGQSLELAAQAREWGEERVYYRDRNGRMRFLPACWTSLDLTDPFVLLAADHAYFRLGDLLRLHERIKELSVNVCKAKYAATVKQIMP